MDSFTSDQILDQLASLLETLIKLKESQNSILCDKPKESLGVYESREKLIDLYFKSPAFNNSTVVELLKNEDYEKIILTNEEYVKKCLDNDPNGKFVVRPFLDSKFMNPEMCNSFAILWAVELGIVDKVNDILEDVNFKFNGQEELIIHSAIVSGHFIITNILLADARITAWLQDKEEKQLRYDWMRIAARNGHLEIFRKLTQKYFDEKYKFEYESLLVLAAGSGHLNIVEYIIGEKYKRPCSSYNALLKAIENGHDHVVVFMLGKSFFEEDWIIYGDVMLKIIEKRRINLFNYVMTHEKFYSYITSEWLAYAISHESCVIATSFLKHIGNIKNDDTHRYKQLKQETIGNFRLVGEVYITLAYESKNSDRHCIIESLVNSPMVRLEAKAINTCFIHKDEKTAIKILRRLNGGMGKNLLDIIIESAARNNFIEFVGCLMNYYKDNENVNLELPLKWAISDGNILMVSELLQYSQAKPESVYSLALEGNNTVLITMLENAIKERCKDNLGSFEPKKYSIEEFDKLLTV